MENKKYYPESTGIDKERIIELINNELFYNKVIKGPEENIKIDDPRLTDEFCQELVNAWWDDEGNLGGDLWEDEDSIEQEWLQKIIKQFTHTPKESEPIKYLTKEEIINLPIKAEFVMRDMTDGEEYACMKLESNDP